MSLVGYTSSISKFLDELFVRDAFSVDEYCLVNLDVLAQRQSLKRYTLIARTIRSDRSKHHLKATRKRMGSIDPPRIAKLNGVIEPNGIAHSPKQSVEPG